jgi:voltage-gated potassium channel
MAYSSRVQSEKRLRALERATEVPLLLLAMAMVPLLLIPVFGHLSEGAEQATLALDWTIWALFAVDFAAKIAVAPQRIAYVRGHPLEAAMVVLPFLRPLRLARFLRLARVATALGLNVEILQELANQRGTRLVVAAVLVSVFAGAGLAYVAEHDEQGANITSYSDALWWAATTVTTVGYGDRYPTTAQGRGVAIVLMLFGIAALSALTAVVAAMLVREQSDAASEPELSEILEELRALRAEVRSLREADGTRARGGGA